MTPPFKLCIRICLFSSFQIWNKSTHHHTRGSALWYLHRTLFIWCVYIIYPVQAIIHMCLYEVIYTYNNTLLNSLYSIKQRCIFIHTSNKTLNLLSYDLKNTWKSFLVFSSSFRLHFRFGYKENVAACCIRMVNRYFIHFLIQHLKKKSI